MSCVAGVGAVREAMPLARMQVAQGSCLGGKWIWTGAPLIALDFAIYFISASQTCPYRVCISQ